MEAIRSSERATRRHLPEDDNHHSHRVETSNLTKPILFAQSGCVKSKNCHYKPHFQDLHRASPNTSLLRASTRGFDTVVKTAIYQQDHYIRHVCVVWHRKSLVEMTTCLLIHCNNHVRFCISERIAPSFNLSPCNLAPVVKTSACIRKVPGSNLDWENNYDRFSSSSSAVLGECRGSTVP
jgi:hypothetical protein